MFLKKRIWNLMTKCRLDMMFGLFKVLEVCIMKVVAKQIMTCFEENLVSSQAFFFGSF